MKKTIIAIFALFLVINVSAQVAPKPKPQKQATESKLDSFVLKGTYVFDTTKVVLFILIADSTTQWRPSYIIAKNFRIMTGNNKTVVDQKIVDKNWQPIKQEVLESVYDSKQFNWK